MSLGQEAEKIEVSGRTLIELLDNGWWVAYCTHCTGKGTAINRGNLDTWIDTHGGSCPPKPWAANPNL